MYIPKINLVDIVFAPPKLKLNGLQELLTLYCDALILIKDNDSPNPTSIAYNVRTNLYNFYNADSLKYGGQTLLEPQNASSMSIKLTKTQLLLREWTRHPKGSSSFQPAT